MGDNKGPPNKTTNEDRMEFAIVRLGQEPYVSWKRHMKNVLVSKGLYDIVTGKESVDADSVRENQAQALLGSALDKVNRMNIIDCTTANQMWKRLESIHEVKTSYETQTLQTKLNTYKMASVNNISESIAEIRYIAARLKVLKEKVSDNNLMSIILHALPKPLKNVQSVWKTMNSADRTLENLVSFVLSEAADLEKPEEAALVAIQKNKGNKSSRYNKNRKNRNNNSKSQDQDGQKKKHCKHCNKSGHEIDNCFKLHPEKRRKRGSIGKDQPSSSQNDSDRKNTERGDKNWSLMAKSSSTSTIDTEWVVDSGSTIHQTSHLEWITGYKELDEPIEVSLGDDHIIHAIGSGKIETDSGTLTKVYYVPELKVNLFSIRTAAMNGVSVSFHDNKAYIYDDDTNMITGHYYDGLYHINLAVRVSFDQEEGRLSALTAATVRDWHERFGHISEQTIKRMIQSKAVIGMELAQQDSNKCESCALGKCHQTTHRTKTTQKANKPGISLHFDTVGPVSYPSLRGSRYFLLCKDEYSSYRMVKFVASKSEITDQVKLLITQAELETLNPVKQIISDNGTEFVNEDLESFTNTKGIVHKKSAPYTPQQNGFIERDIRTVVESARTMLIQNQLPKPLWTEASNNAVYLLNRSLNVNSDSTPYELWFGGKPNVSNLHKFGQRAIILKRDQRAKFDSTGNHVKFVGYTENFNTYRFYVPEDDKIVISSDAIFLDENGNHITAEKQAVDDTTSLIVGNSSQGTIEHIENPTSSSSESSDKGDTDESTVINDTNDDSSDDGYLYDTPDASMQERSRFTTPPHPKRAPPAPPSRPHKAPRPSEISLGHVLPSRLRSRSSNQSTHHAKVSVIDDIEEPTKYSEAMSRNDKHHWKSAMDDEIASLIKNEVWRLVDKTKGNIVTCKWVYKIKRKPNNQIERYKARLVARGFSQRYGIDYSETYAPVANMVSLRMLFAYAAVENLNIAQFDIKTAFLYGKLDEEIYMEQPEGYVKDKNKVCLLEKSLYGLKQALRQWNIEFTNFLKELGLVASSADRCIFYRKEPALVIAIYVDDGLIIAKDAAIINKTLEDLGKRFQTTVLSAQSYLGFEFRKHGGDVFLHQEGYIKKIIKKFGMEDSKSVDTPMTIVEGEDKTPADVSIPYREAIGSLMYAAVNTRLDIMHAVAKASRHCENPTEADWRAVKRIFRYLRGKEDIGICYSKMNNKELVAYCDADFAGDKDSGKSTTGSVFMYAGGPIHWKSQRQSLVTLSSTEAEYVSLCSTVKETAWIRRFAIELGIIDDKPTLILCDNESAIKIASNEKSIHRTRHMMVQAAYPREMMERGEIDIEHVGTNDQLADVLTKPTSTSKFKSNISKIMNKLTYMAFTMLYLIMVLSCTESYTFHKTKPIVWIPIDNAIITDTIEYEVDFTYISPCESIPTDREHKNAVPYAQEKDYDVFRTLKADCYHRYNHTYLPQIYTLTTKVPPKTDESRKRRGIGDFIGGFGVGIMASCVSNVISSIFEIVGTRRDHDRLQELVNQHEITKQRIEQFEENFNLHETVTKGIIDSISMMSNQLRIQKHQIEHLSLTIPRISVYATYIDSRIMASTVDLKTIIDEYGRGMVATAEMADLLNMTELRGVDNRDTQFLKVTKWGYKNMRFTFIVSKMSKDTKVYEVQPFQYWDNLTHTPSLMEYHGSRFLIYNKTSNCIKSIAKPTTRVLYDTCTEQNGTDSRLSIWRALLTTNDISRETNVTAVFKSLKYNYIYCFPSNITIDGISYRCPPYVFRMSYSESFSVDHETYVPIRRKLVIKQDELPVEDNVHWIHFDPESNAADELNMFDDLRNLSKQLDKIKFDHEHSIVVEEYGRTWWTCISTIAINIIILAICAYIITRSQLSRKASLSSGTEPASIYANQRITDAETLKPFMDPYLSVSQGSLPPTLPKRMESVSSLYNYYPRLSFKGAKMPKVKKTSKV